MTSHPGIEAGAGRGSGLIASDRVEGTPVRRPGGDKIGTIERVMIEKATGRVAYAVMSIGGVVGIGGEHTTLPWSVLAYNTELDAYELDRSEEELRGAPRSERPAGDPSFDRDWEEHVHSYFETRPYWSEDAPRASQETRGSREDQRA